MMQTEKGKPDRSGSYASLLCKETNMDFVPHTNMFAYLGLY